MKNTIITILVILPILALITLGFTANQETNTCLLSGTEVKNTSETSTYLLFCENGDVYSNVDNIFFGKFNSSNIQASLKVGKTYELKTQGWRIPFLSMYKNVISVEENNE